MRDARDDAPLVVRTGLRASHARWNAAGTHLAVAGVHVSSDGRDVNAVHFYTSLGALACSLRVPGAKINALCWEGSGTRVALAVDSFVYFANISPDYAWGYFGNTLRALGMGTRRWRMRHFVLYDNHLFWGRGFSRMYGYATVLSAYASPEDGETSFVLELVTHPKFSLRRGGLDSMDYWQRLYGLCCSTHGYSRRLLRAGTVIDRDRWIAAVTRGLPALASTSPVSPAEAMLITEEQSVFAVTEDGRRDSLEEARDDALGGSEDLSLIHI